MRQDTRKKGARKVKEAGILILLVNHLHHSFYSVKASSKAIFVVMLNALTSNLLMKCIVGPFCEMHCPWPVCEPLVAVL